MRTARAGVWVWLATLVLVACGGTTEWTDDLLGVGRVVEITPDAVRLLGDDVSGLVPDVGVAEPRLWVYEFELGQGKVRNTLEGIPQLPGRVLFVRSKLDTLRLEDMAQPGERLLILLRPLLERTRGGVDLEGLALAVSATGQVGSSDWADRGEAWTKVVGLGPSPLEAVGDLVEAVSDRTRGLSLTARQQQLLDAAG